MFLPVIKRFVTVFFIVAFTLFAKAQQTHFVYLQTENGQPFYIKTNNKIVSSSSAGYLILPNLQDGDYELSVGFPKKEFPEENFKIPIDKKNLGFLLKNFGEKGWGLFNMQSYKIVMGGNTEATAGSSKNLQDDPFSKMLANVVKDSSILQKNEPLKQEVAVGTKSDSSLAKSDSSLAKNDSGIVAEKIAPLQLSPATRFLSKKNADGLEMIYIDPGQSPNDTVRIFIPSKKTVIKAAKEDTGIAQNAKSSITPVDTTSAIIEQPATQMKPDTAQPVSREEGNKQDNKDSVITKKTEVVVLPEANPQDLERTGNKAADAKKDDMVVLPGVVQSSGTNSDCKAFADVDDFLKLRKKMASGNSNDNMIKIAKKAFHSKCFSTGQIKNLSFLFLTDEGKYEFFDMAYPFASDSDQYNTLQAQLTDSYYINRFKGNDS